MKSRIGTSNLVFVRFYSVKAVAFVLALSLIGLMPQTAFASNACISDPAGVACVTAKANSLQVVVNKTRALNPKNYYPNDLVKIPKFNPYGRIIRKSVSKAIVAMGVQMKHDKKGTLVVQSGFRSFASQTKIHNSKVKALGKVKGENLAARPGYSEHQTGLAVDFGAAGVSTLQISFAKSKAGIWLAANAHRYGFVLRYPKGKTGITGYQFEPWHFRFVGVTVATQMFNQKIATLEEYYGLPAAPRYLN